jgi:hypothetical protein
VLLCLVDQSRTTPYRGIFVYAVLHLLRGLFFLPFLPILFFIIMSGSSSSSSKDVENGLVGSNPSMAKSPLLSHPTPYYATVCNMLISQLLQNERFINEDGITCTMCNQSLHLHSQLATQLSTTSSNTSKSILDKNVIHDLPQWKKDYKVCNTFFNALEQLFIVHNITDDSLYKRYLFSCLDELHDSDKTYAFNHIINTEYSWSEIKILFAQRFETFDHVNRLRKQFTDIRYTHNDTIQTFSNRFINICNDLSYSVDDSQTIHKFLTLLPNDMHRRLLLSIETSEKSIEDYTTLTSIVQKIIRLENAQNNAAFVTSSDSNNSSHKRNNHSNDKQKGTSSTPAKYCKYHPGLSSHTTAECRTGPSKSTSSSSGGSTPVKHHSTSSPSTPARPSFASNLSTPGRTQPTCHHCGKPGHFRPQCPDLAPAKPKPSQPSQFTAGTLTRSAYVANGVKPTGSGPSVKTLSTSTSESSSSDVAFKTFDRTISADVCSLDFDAHPVLMPITIQGQTFYGLADTGASSSCVDPLIPAMFGFNITPIKGTVYNADVRVQSPRIGTCIISADLTIADTDNQMVLYNPDDRVKQVKFKQKFDVFPVYDKNSGHHFLIGRDILGPLFHKGIPPEYSVPDAHVELPEFEDPYYDNIVNSMRSRTSNSSSDSLSVSSIRFNTLTFTGSLDSVDIHLNQTHIIQ